jgi:hypothetical protein
MILASRIPQLTDEILNNTLRAAVASARGADWQTLAEVEHLERRLLALLRRLDRGDGAARRAA